jgi:hypothetical protein
MPAEGRRTGPVSGLSPRVELYERQRSHAGALEFVREQSALPVGEGSQHLGLADVVPREELPASRGAPTALAHQQLPDCPCECLVGWVQDYVRGGGFSVGDPSLQFGAGEPDRVGSFKCSQSLRRRAHCGGLRHLVLRFLPFLRLGGSRFTNGQGPIGPPPVGPVLRTAVAHAEARGPFSTPVSGLPYPLAAWSARPFGSWRSYGIRAGNSNVTTAGHALRACFFCERGPCASVDKHAVAEPSATTYLRAGSGPCLDSKACFA